MAKIAEQTFPKGISISSHYAQDLALLDGDPTQLHQVLLNLAVNSRDAMPNGGKLVLAAANFDVDEHYAAMTPGLSAGPHVLITVADTGTGIPPHVMEKMFDPFFTTKEIGKGSGLGLSTLLGIVKSHGGAVNAASSPAGLPSASCCPLRRASSNSPRSIPRRTFLAVAAKRFWSSTTNHRSVMSRRCCW
jgi:signal transduction histidine kinase